MRVLDLIPDIKRKLANRTDVEAYAPYFVRDAVYELTDDYDFTELEVIGQDIVLTIGERAYNLELFKPANSDFELNRVTMLEMFTDTTNTRSIMLKFREAPVVIPMSRITGSFPSVWTRHGNQIIIACKPSQALTLIPYIQRKHTFPEDSASLKGSKIFMPDNWREIIVLSAAIRAATELRIPDYVTLYYNILHGDPKRPGDLGLLRARVSQHEKDKRTNEGNIPPIVQPYTFGR